MTNARFSSGHFYSRLKDVLMGQMVQDGPEGIQKGVAIDESILGQFTPGQWRQIAVENDEAIEGSRNLRQEFDDKVDADPALVRRQGRENPAW